MFSPDVEKNKAIVKNFFFVIVYDGKPVLREGQKANALCKGTEKISLTKHSWDLMRRLRWNRNAISSKKLARPSYVEGNGIC